MKTNHLFPVRQLRLLALLSLLWMTAFAAEPQIEITHAHADAIYQAGEKVIWTIQLKNVDTSDAEHVEFLVERGGLEKLAAGELNLSAVPQQIESSLEAAGSLLLTVTVKISGKDKPLRVRSGALIDPDNIKASLPKPNDFDAFWQEKLAEQDKIPMNPQLTLEKTHREGVESWTITLDTIRNQKVQGRLARPKKDGKFPALLIVQWAGVYGLDPNWSVHQASNGFLVLNTLAHDQPVDQDKQFYTDLANGPLKSYAAIGNSDRETSYFLRMCLACSRAVDYLSQHPDWDGKHILVTGGSQGGYQAFVAAGLNQKVTALLAAVPAGCDHSAMVAQRAIGWPYWMSGDLDNQQKLEASRYFDGVNFASNITCPALVGFGMGDSTSRVEGILAAVHAMQGPVVTDITPNREHNAGKFLRYDQLTKAWKDAVLAGQPIPLGE